MYRLDFMDHYHHSAYRGQLNNPDFKSGSFNPSCGDTVSIEGRIVGKYIVELKFEGKGCVISQATASLLSHYCLNKTTAEILTIDAHKIQELIQIDLGPTRLRCALLSVEALHQGINEYL